MTKFIVLFLCLVSCSSAYARLGWTKAQMEEKFGIPYVYHLENNYQVDEFNSINAIFDGDKVVIIEYIKTMPDSVIENTTVTEQGGKSVKTTKFRSPAQEVYYSEEEADVILKTNFPDVKWLKNNKAAPLQDMQAVTDSYGLGGKDWTEYKRFDGMIYAYLCKNPPKLVIFEKAKSARIIQLRKQQDAMIKESEKKEKVSDVKGKF